MPNKKLLIKTKEQYVADKNITKNWLIIDQENKVIIKVQPRNSNDRKPEHLWGRREPKQQNHKTGSKLIN